MKKLLLFVLALATVATTSTAQTCTPDPIYNDSLPGIYGTDLPPLVQGQPYNATVYIKTMSATEVTFQGIPVQLYVRAMKLLDVVNEPAGFVIAPNYNDPNGYWLNGGSDPDYTSILGCYTISADVNSVNAAIANNGGSGILDFDVYYDIWAKGNPIPATYTWISTLGTPPYGASIIAPLTLGGTVDYNPWTGNTCVYGFLYNGISSSYAGLDANSGSYQLQVNSSLSSCNWYAYTYGDWFTISPETGTGDGTMTVTYTENTTGEPRYGEISIDNTIYNLTQISGECNVVMNIDTSFVGPLEGTIYITVDAADSCYWSIINRNQFCDWVDVNPESGTGPGTIEISYNANNSTDARQCEININGTTITLNQTTVGLNENAAGKLQLYPNPAADLVNITLPSTTGKNTLSIYNTAGQLISQQNLTTQTNQISTISLANGIYLFVVQNADSVIGRSMVEVNR